MRVGGGDGMSSAISRRLEVAYVFPLLNPSLRTKQHYRCAVFRVCRLRIGFGYS
jgi:hypothetical protein